MSEVTTPIIIPAGDIQPLVPFTLPGSGGMDIQDVDTGTPGDGTGGASPVPSPGTVPANGNSENFPDLAAKRSRNCKLTLVLPPYFKVRQGLT